MFKSEKLEKNSRQAWLFGLGALLSGKELIADKIDAYHEQANSLLSDLLQKGEDLDGELSTKVSTDKTKAKAAIDERVADIRKKLGLDKTESESPKTVDSLTQKVDELTAKVAELVAAKETVKTPAAKKPAAKKATATKAEPKAAAAKKPASKPNATAARKTTAKPAAKKAAPAAKKAPATKKPAASTSQAKKAE
jgi:polyhydroxyalkanoate synthesis regulator phasin